MTAATLFTHPDGLGTIEYNEKNHQLVILNEEHGDEAFANIGPQGLIDLASTILKLPSVVAHVQWTEHAAEMDRLVKEHGELAFTDPQNIGILETLVATAPTEKLKTIVEESLRSANFRRVRQQMKSIEDEHGIKEAVKREDHAALLIEAFRYAPADFLNVVSETAQEMDLLPEPSGVDEHGRPVYDLSAISQKLGVPEEDLLDELQEVGIEPIKSPIHTLQ